jgi:hypothetical protein
MLAAATVTATNNPQVALYTMTLPSAGTMGVEFGTDTNYGLKTWSRPADGSGRVSVFVAGMRASTTYHVRAVVTLANGMTVNDVDHVFTTGAVPESMRLNATVATAAGMTPQPGVELLNPLIGTPSGVLVTDLAGNTLWTYANPATNAQNYLNGVKMLSNGDFLMVIGMGIPFNGLPPNVVNEVREVNLAGDTVRSVTVDAVNAALSTATCVECKVTLATFHHEVEPLANGHWLLLAAAQVPLSSTTVPALTNAAATTVTGDVIVDLDANLKPVWVWNSFNHLDVNRHPMGVADWTHSNAIVYSKDDGNLLLSSRNQSWVVKIKYSDGMGDGSVMWRLGAGGDFKLQGGKDPTDWMYAQHLPAFFSTNTTGVFSLGVMDNGNGRVLSDGTACGTQGAPACYTTIPVWRIDEGAKTATLLFHQVLPPAEYNFFGGNIEQLTNGHMEYDLCGVGSLPKPSSMVFEVTQDVSAQTVWSMKVQGTYLYRASRMESLYPGVQW